MSAEKSLSATIDELLERPYWVVDPLPEQVPEGGRGQFFAVERLYLLPPRYEELRRRFADILLKLNCYYDFTVVRDEADAGAVNPAPEELVHWVVDGSLHLNIVVGPDEAHNDLMEHVSREQFPAE